MSFDKTPTPLATRRSPFLAWCRRHLRVPVTGVLIATFALWSTQARGVTGYWTLDGNGAWTNPANWQDGTIPLGADDVANFNFNITGNRTLTLESPWALHGMVFGDSLGGQGYTIAGTSSDIMYLEASGGQNAFINKYNSATDVWQAPLQLNTSTDFNIYAGTFQINGASNTQVPFTSTFDVFKNGSGTTQLNGDLSAFSGNFVLNFGSLTLGGANSGVPSLGTGTNGILIKGSGNVDRTVLNLQNNGTGSNGVITYQGNNDIVLQGAATISVNQNFVGGANTGNTIVMDNLTMGGGLLQVNGGNSYALRVSGTTTLGGQTNVFLPNTAQLTLAGPVTDGTASRALIKEGAGRLLLTNTGNTFDGPTAIKDGYLQLGAGANLGNSITYVNGGALSPDNKATLDAVSTQGLVMVGQLGTSRYILPAIGYSQNYGAITTGNEVNVNVPVAGMVLAIDTIAGNVTNNIDLSKVGGGSNRVWISNLLGADRTYQGVITPGLDNTIRLTSGSNNLIISGSANRLGGTASTAKLVFGFDHVTPASVGGATISQVQGGTVSVRVDNDTSGAVTIHRGMTVNVNGTGLVKPLGTGTVTLLGGTLNTSDSGVTANSNDVKLGNTDFRLFGGSTLLLDNAAVTTTPNTNRRLDTTTDIALSSSTLRLIGDGGAATVSSQAIDALTYRGGSTISVDTDGTTAGRLTTLTLASLNRQDRGTLNLRSISNNATTFGTSAGTQKLIVTAAPTVTNGMVGADVVLWGGANSNDAGTPLFATYDATHGIQAAAMTSIASAANLAAATATTIASINGLAIATSGNATVQALNLKSTASTHALTGNTITIGASAGAGQGAGLFIAHTSNDTVTHTSNFTFGGNQEGLLYAATSGGTSGVIVLSGVVAGTNGVTRFGDGILRLSGANTFTGPLTLNAGETRLNNIAAAGGSPTAPNDTNVFGGSVYFEAANSRYYTNLNFYDNARVGNVNVGATGFNNLTVQPRVGSTDPVVLLVQAQAGSNSTTAYGSMALNGPLQLLTPHVLQVNGGMTGSAPIDKYFNERLILAGDASGYSGAITSYTSAVVSYNSLSSAKPFGTGTLTMNPGAGITLAAPSNINASQLTVKSDHGGISYIGQLYVADPVTTLPAFTMSSTAPWKGAFGVGAVGFSVDINQSTLFGGNTYLGAPIGYTGIYTGTLTPAASGYLLGTAQGRIRIAKPLTGANNAIIGISMTGDSSRADQFVNNSGGVVQYDVPMTYTGNTILNQGPLLRISAKNALSATGDIIFAGGQLRVDPSSGQNRMIAPISVSNNIIMTADSSIQMENSAYDMRLGGSISLAPGSNGVVRTLTIGSDQPGAAQNNAGIVYTDGGITDGAGGAGNHFVKAGPGTLFFTGANTYSGSTTIAGGLIGVNGDTDWGNTSLVNMINAGVAVWENSFETSRNYHLQGGSGYFDIGPGLTLTQNAAAVIDGTSSIIKRGLGTMVVNGTNAVTGIFLGDGILQFNTLGSLGDPASTSAFSFGGDQTIAGANNGTRYTGGTVRINFSGTTGRGLVFNNNGNTNFSGGIDVTTGNIFTVTGAITQGTELDYGFKTGGGTMLTTGANTMRGFVVADGTMQFANSTPWANSTTTATDNTFIEMMGGTIYAVNAGANIALTNAASTTTYNYGGGMHLRMGSGAGFSVEFAADNLLRQNQGTLVIETEGATTLGGVGGSNTGRLLTVNAVNSGLARASAVTNGVYPAHLVGADGNGVAFFLGDNATTGFVPYAGATITSLTGTNPTAIGDISSAASLSGINSVYAFRTSANVSGGTLKVTAIDNVRSGGVLINGSNTVSTNLVFDPTSITAAGTGTSGEALVYVKTGESALISGNVTSNAFTKFGRGELTLSGSTSILGELSVQDGTLKIGNSNTLNRLNTELNVNSGAVVDLNGSNVALETIGSNNRQIATSNLGGTITNTNSSNVSTLMVGGAVSSAYNGTLKLGIKLVKAGSGVLTINGYSASTPDAGANTYTGGTDIYGVSGASILGGATTNGSATVTVTSTAGLAPGMIISGTGINANSYITSITNGTTFTISQNATATNTGLTFTSVGGLTVNNAPNALGGFGNSVTGDVNLYSGNLNLFFSNGNTGVNGTQGMNYNSQVIKLGAENTDGIALNVRGPGSIYVNQGLVSSNGTFGQGNIVQVGALNMTNTVLTLGGGNLYRLRAAGPISILGSQAAFQTNQSDGPSGALELTGVISGAGALTKLGDGTLRGIVISNPSNTYTGGTNIVAGDVQVTATSGTPLGTGPVRVFPDGTLRLASNSSVDGSKLTVLSRSTAMGVVMIDDNFNPTVLNSSNFTSVYNTALHLGQPFFTQPLNMASIADGKAFLGAGLNAEVAYTAATLGAGVPDAWNPGAGVYRISPGSTSLAFSGTDNVLTGTNYLQVGPQRNNILGVITNGGNVVVIRNSNDFTAGTQITKGAGVYIETGGRASGETPLGTGAIEVYGELRIRGAQGSLWNASTSSQTNVVNLRPGGVIRLHEADGANAITFVGAGNQGRWGDSVGIDLNGGEFRYDGASNLQSFETIGDVAARKRGILTVARNSGGSSAQLNVGNITRTERGVLHLNYNAGFLGIPATTPLSYERIVATAIDGAAPVRGGTTTNGAGVINGGMLAPWIIDRTTHSFVGYDPTAVAGTGFQPLISNAAPAAGQLSYNRIIAAGPITTVAAGDIVDLTTAAMTLGQNVTAHALRTSQNISPTASFNSMTFTSGGLIFTGATATVNPTGAITAGVVSPMTLNFGTGGAGEAFIYNNTTAIIQAQIAAGQGLTKSGAGQLQIHSINPGINGPVTMHEGTLYVRVPYSTSGSPVGQVLNGQDIVVNGGTLNLQSQGANAAGTASEIASNVTSAQSRLDGTIFIRGDAALRVNNSGQYVQIADLTIANSAGSAAMNGNSTITLNLQSGIWVRGTTTLAPEAVINGTFDGFSQATLAGKVTGAGGLIKHGNGATTLMSPINDYAGGTTIWGSTVQTATSTVASALRGPGTPFSTGTINIQPGGHLRVADNANIASNPVYLRSDGYGLGGIGLAHNGVLPSIVTSGTPTVGQIKVESSGPFAGVVSLDYGYYSKTLDMAAIPGGAWWLGNSQQAEAYYFNSTLGVATGGKYLLGGGGNQSGITFGSVLVSGGRNTLFENMFSGGSAGQVRVEIGAQTGDFAWNSPAFVNGNSGFMFLSTRNTGLVGDVRVNTGSTLGLGNNFALGSGRLIINGGGLRFDVGNNNFATAAAGVNQLTINNDVVFQGDYNVANQTSSSDLIVRGNVALSDVVTSGATRTLNINAGNISVLGVVSGAAGSNLIKTGAGNLVLSGANTYQGYTQVGAGFLFYGGDVKPNVAGPLGISDSPVVLAGGSMRSMGKLSFDRDLIVNNSGTFDTATWDATVMNGGVSILTGQTLTVGAVAADVSTFRGGLLQFNGAISGGGALTVGTTAAAPAIGGTVYFAGNSNGYGINTYSGTTTIQSARVQLGGSSYYAGPADNPTAILSGPMGIGTITIGAGESNRGAIFEAVGGPVTLVNPLAALNTAANTSITFGGHEALTFTRSLDLNSDTTLRNRTIIVQNLYQPLTFSGALSGSGAAGVSLIKSGPGMLILNGANTFATSSTQGIQINQGIVRVNSDAALGAAGAVRLNGGALSVSDNVSTSRQVILQANGSGIDVASGKTVTLSAATSGAFTLNKTGPGTLMLNASGNNISTLILGGQPQLNAGTGFFSHTGGIVGTTATSGTPFATSAVTINSGALSLVGGATAQALSVPTITYGAAGAVTLNMGTTTSQLTVSTALTRGGAVAGSFSPALPTAFGTMYVAPSLLGNLGTTEKVIVSAGAPANTATGGGNILTTPAIFIKPQTPGDANFARYDSTTGIREHDVSTVASLAATDPTKVANVTAIDIAGTGNIDVQALRTNANITPTDGSTLVRIARGGLIMNGTTAPVISAPLLFGTDVGASLTEAIVYVRDGQTGASTLNGGITARDFTKTGPGVLEVGGTANFLNPNSARLPVVSVQDGTMRLTSSGSAFKNGYRGTVVGDYLGHAALNVNEAGIFDLNGNSTVIGALAGNGTITSGVAGAVNLVVKNGFGQDSTFTGSIANGSGTVSLTKTQNGILTLGGNNTFSGGVTIESGRVTNGIGSTVGLGRLEAQTVSSLGTSDVTLQGGWLRLNAGTVLGGAQSISEVGTAIDYLQWGNAGGMNVTVSNTGYANGVLLPQNLTSTITAVTQNAGIKNLTINAPMVSLTEGIIVQVNGTTTFSQPDTTMRVLGGRFFLTGKVDAANKTITKTGASDVVVLNSASGLGQNNVGLWKVYGGVLEARSAIGSANPLGANSIVEVNGGSTNYGLRLLTDGDGTGLGMRIKTYADTTVRFGSSLPVSSNAFVSSGASRVGVDRAMLANSSFKTVEINNIEVNGALGSAYAYFVLGNNDSVWVNGTTTFQRDLRLQVDGGQGLTLNGLISGNGTFSRNANGGSLYINADNSSGYFGGTFFTGSGRNYLGSLEGSQLTLSNTAKLGAGNVFIGPNAMFQINSAGNLQANQNFYVSGNLSWGANFSLAADLTLDQVGLRSAGLGGIQNGAANYYLSASNPSSGMLSLGTIYTKALDMRALGDGMWYLGSSTNGIGANGAYDAATLAPGLGNTYRLGAGGNILFFGTNGAANVLTDSDVACPSNLVVGAPMTVQSMGPTNFGTGTVVLLQNQNYTGSTLVNWQSTLDFRGTMETSGFEVYGTLNVAGESGTFLKSGTGANIPVTLRPGAFLRFDNTSAGVLPLASSDGRWQDSVGISLNDSVLRLQGNAAVEVVETVGAITANNGGNRIEVVRGVAGRGTELRTPSITRVGNGTIQFVHNGSQLGSDERVILTGPAPTVTNGMVAPWMVSNSDNQFITYNADNGFTIAGFDHSFATAGTIASSVSLPTSRALFTAAPTLNGADYSVWALRLDADVSLTTASAATNTTNRLIIGSGGLLSNAARTVQAGIWAGTSGTDELIIYNNNTLNVGILANNTTSGRIKASGITKMGSGTLVLLSEQSDFSGDIRIQQGALQLNHNGAATDTVSNIAGTAGNIIFQGNNTTLNLRFGDTPFTAMNITLPKSIVIGDYVSVATINYDRIGSVTGKNIYFNNLTFGANNGDVGQVLRLLNPTNDGYRLHFNGTTTLTGRSSFAVDNNYTGSASEVMLNGLVTGSGTLVKGASDSRTRTLNLLNTLSLNNYTGGTVLQGGNLLTLGMAPSVAANTSSNIGTGGLGSGPITLMGGVLDVRFDSNQLTDKTGTYTRSGTTVTVTTPTAHGYANGQVITVTTGPEQGAFVITGVPSSTTFTYTSLSSGTVASTPFTSIGPDADIEFVRYTGGTGSGLDLNVNGSVQINADRNTHIGTWSRTGNIVTVTLPGGHGLAVNQSITIPTGGGPTAGNFTITGVSGNTVTYTDTASGSAVGNAAVVLNAGSNKMLTFNNMTIGSQILTTSGGNGYGLAVAGTTTLLGNAFLNVGTETVLGGGAGAAGTANSITTDGGQVLINKIGTGTLWVHSTNNSLTGPVYINGGLLAFGNRAVGNNTATLGIGDIFVNPGAEIQVRALTNINTASGQELVLTGTPYSPSIIRATAAFTQANFSSLIRNTTAQMTSNDMMVIGFEGTPAAENFDQSALGNGRVFFASVSADRTITGSGTNGSLTPGLADLPNNVIGNGSTNRVYRFGGRNSAALVLNLNGTGNLNDVGGPTDVMIGSLANLGPSANWGLGQVVMLDQNTYTGQTTVSRGSTLRFQSISTATAGPLGGLTGGFSAAPIHVYGTLQVESNGTFRDVGGTGNAYSNINLHPGSSLVLLDNNATTNANRWNDTTGINLDGARFTLDAANNVDLSAETVGAITFDRGARIQTVNQGTSEILLTAASITRAAAGPGAGTGRGTMVFTPGTSGNLGLPSATNNAEQVKFTSAPALSSVAPTMLPGYFMDGTGHRFVGYNATNGVTPIADGGMVAMPTGAGAGNEIVNVTAAVTMGSFETSIFALRGGAFTINSPTGANNDATIILTGSGADIGAVASFGAFVINPNLKFGATGTNEALFYTGSTLTVNGNITAGSITKFGVGGTLVIANDQSDAARGVGNGYQGGWVVNEGAIQFGQFGSGGNAVPGNTIVLNGAQAGAAQLNLRAQPADTLLNYTYSSGRIIAVDNATIDWDPGAADRVHKIADIEIQQSGGIGNATANSANDAILRVAVANSRNILAAGELILTNNAILNVDATTAGSPFAAYAGNASYLTNGMSSGLSVAKLSGSQRFTKWGDGTLYVRGDSSASFTGPVIIDQGAVHVSHNGALGTGALTINRYGTLEIGVANFAQTNSSVTYNAGSIERWSVNNARSGTLNLGKGTLQVAADQPTTSVAVTLNGGGIEAFLRNDDQIAASSGAGVMRVLNPNITFSLAGDSFLGSQYYLGANGLDNGRQTLDNRPLEEYLASGAILDIKGVISGPGGLTKVGYDTVFLSGSNTYAGATKVEGGKLMIGKDNALPVTTSLTTTANGVLDLNGQNQTIGSLSNPGTPATGVNSTSGFITNSGTTMKTLTVGNGVSADFTYSGVIQHNVAVAKTGTATMTLNNANTYRGDTTISAGALKLGQSGTIDDSPWIKIGSNARLDVSAKTSGYTYDGVISGGGTDTSGKTFATAANVAKISGAITVGDHIGEVCLVGSMSPGGSSVVTDIVTAGNQIGHIYTDNAVTLSGAIAGSSPAASTTRLSLQLNGPTSTLASLGYTTGAYETFINALPTTNPGVLNGLTGDLTGHDYVNVGGTLTLNQNGKITVGNFGSYTPAIGDLFNLLDWVSLTANTFNFGSRYQDGTENNDLDLPSLSGGLLWDTSLFQSHGVVIVVSPEPGRVMLLLLGLLAMFGRRRRR